MDERILKSDKIVKPIILELVDLILDTDLITLELSPIHSQVSIENEQVIEQALYSNINQNGFLYEDSIKSIVDVISSINPTGECQLNDNNSSDFSSSLRIINYNSMSLFNDYNFYSTNEPIDKNFDAYYTMRCDDNGKFEMISDDEDIKSSNEKLIIDGNLPVCNSTEDLQSQYVSHSYFIAKEIISEIINNLFCFRKNIEENSNFIEIDENKSTNDILLNHSSELKSNGNKSIDNKIISYNNTDSNIKINNNLKNCTVISSAKKILNTQLKEPQNNNQKSIYSPKNKILKPGFKFKSIHYYEKLEIDKINNVIETDKKIWDDCYVFIKNPPHDSSFIYQKYKQSIYKINSKYKNSNNKARKSSGLNNKNVKISKYKNRIEKEFILFENCKSEKFHNLKLIENNITRNDHEMIKNNFSPNIKNKSNYKIQINTSNNENEINVKSKIKHFKTTKLKDAHSMNNNIIDTNFSSTKIENHKDNFFNPSFLQYFIQTKSDNLTKFSTKSPIISNENFNLHYLTFNVKEDGYRDPMYQPKVKLIKLNPNTIDLLLDFLLNSRITTCSKLLNKDEIKMEHIELLNNDEIKIKIEENKIDEPFSNINKKLNEIDKNSRKLKRKNLVISDISLKKYKSNENVNVEAINNTKLINNNITYLNNLKSENSTNVSTPHKKELISNRKKYKTYKEIISNDIKNSTNLKIFPKQNINDVMITNESKNSTNQKIMEIIPNNRLQKISGNETKNIFKEEEKSTIKTNKVLHTNCIESKSDINVIKHQTKVNITDVKTKININNINGNMNTSSNVQNSFAKKLNNLPNNSTVDTANNIILMSNKINKINTNLPLNLINNKDNNYKKPSLLKSVSNMNQILAETRKKSNEKTFISKSCDINFAPINILEQIESSIRKEGFYKWGDLSKKSEEDQQMEIALEKLKKTKPKIPMVKPTVNNTVATTNATKTSMCPLLSPNNLPLQNIYSLQTKTLISQNSEKIRPHKSDDIRLSSNEIPWIRADFNKDPLGLESNQIGVDPMDIPLPTKPITILEESKDQINKSLNPTITLQLPISNRITTLTSISISMQDKLAKNNYTNINHLMISPQTTVSTNQMVVNSKDLPTSQHGYNPKITMKNNTLNSLPSSQKILPNIVNGSTKLTVPISQSSAISLKNNSDWYRSIIAGVTYYQDAKLNQFALLLRQCQNALKTEVCKAEISILGIQDINPKNYYQFTFKDKLLCLSDQNRYAQLFSLISIDDSITFLISFLRELEAYRRQTLLNTTRNTIQNRKNLNIPNIKFISSNNRSITNIVSTNSEDTHINTTQSTINEQLLFDEISKKITQNNSKLNNSKNFKSFDKFTNNSKQTPILNLDMHETNPTLNLNYMDEIPRTLDDEEWTNDNERQTVESEADILKKIERQISMLELIIDVHLDLVKIDKQKIFLNNIPSNCIGPRTPEHPSIQDLTPPPKQPHEIYIDKEEAIETARKCLMHFHKRGEVNLQQFKFIMEKIIFKIRKTNTRINEKKIAKLVAKYVETL